MGFRLSCDDNGDRFSVSYYPMRTLEITFFNLWRNISMATIVYFEETVNDQGGKDSIELEVGRLSFAPEDSVCIKADGKTIIMNRATAKRFV